MIRTREKWRLHTIPKRRGEGSLQIIFILSIHIYRRPSARVDPHLLKKSRTHECRPYRASNREHGSNRSTDPSIESRLAIGKEGFGNPPSTPLRIPPPLPLTLLKCADGRLSEQQKNHSSN
ncbi:hypothetical protein CDAR_516961 [Caerostris darwini]|uniref:Uncharacterized protein n=1 Tax=Caerostris darwini TaxID=1538125 RepID=A0AAV4UDV6_9ARAC|nr:hypothetical protein CDAR_516961 [Caerostris darwini]